jgi:hypothetical protein
MYMEKNLSPCHFIHHKYHMPALGLGLGHHNERPVTTHLRRSYNPSFGDELCDAAFRAVLLNVVEVTAFWKWVQFAPSVGDTNIPTAYHFLFCFLCITSVLY